MAEAIDLGSAIGKRFAANGARFALGRCVHENDGGGAADGLSQLRPELMESSYLNL